MTTNEDFVVVIGSDSSVSHGHAKFVHVGDNLAGHEFIEGTGRVIEGVEFCIHHTSTDNLYSPYKYSRCFLFSELNLTSGIAPYVGSSPMFYGHFGTVSNNGSSTSSDASTFSIEATFLVKNINANTNGKTITLTSKIYHSPSIRNYVSNLNFKVKHFTIGFSWLSLCAKCMHNSFAQLYQGPLSDFALRMFFYASDLLARQMAAEIVTCF